MSTRARDLLIGVLLAGVGLAGLAWQVEGPSSASARPVLVCPLGAHGLAPAPFPRVVAAPALGTRGTVEPPAG